MATEPDNEFRAIARINGPPLQAHLTERTYVQSSWPQPGEELAHAFRIDDAVTGGEIVCLDPDGRSKFRNLLFRREWPYFAAFDLRSVIGEDVRRLPVLERKARPVLQ